MQKVIKDKEIYFYDDNNNLIMCLDYRIDDFVWYFNTNEVIKINEDMEIYSLIDEFMNEEYIFSDELLKSYKDKNKLIWYSDCYYNPDDEWSIASVSCINIVKKDSCFIIKCTKKLDEIIDRPHKTYGICFSPAGNGKYSKNLNTGLTLQDDFVTCIYQPLLNKNKVLKKQLN